MEQYISGSQLFRYREPGHVKYRFVLEQLMEGSGKDVKAIYIIGGGSKNKLLNQFTANVTGRKVYTGPEEASSIGNIMMQAVGDGMVDSLLEVRKIIKASFCVEEYRPQEVPQWHAEYVRFKTEVLKLSQSDNYIHIIIQIR